MSNYTGYNMAPGCSNVDIPGFDADRPGLEIDYGRDEAEFRPLTRIGRDAPDMSEANRAWRKRLAEAGNA